MFKKLGVLFAGAMLIAAGLLFTLPQSPKTISIIDSTGIETLTKVRDAIQEANGHLVINITSPGGPVITSLEIARLLHNASEKGMIVEVHASGICASGCTFVLAAGTKGYRFVSEGTMTVIHGPQTFSFFEGPQCVSKVDKPKNIDDMLTNYMIDSLAKAYSHYTGKPLKVTEKWVSCGQEQGGGEQILIKNGIADKVE